MSNGDWEVRKKYIIGALLLSAVAALGMYLLVFVRTGLPSDGEMADRFWKHEKEFNEIARRYRDFEEPDGKSQYLWGSQPGTAELLAKAGIYQVIADGSTPSIPVRVLEMNGWRRAEDYSSSQDSYKYIDRYGVLKLTPYPRRKYERLTISHSLVWKGYRNFPVEPRVVNGQLRWGNSASRIVDSLDRFPSDWKTGECVYKKLDATWYMHLCNGH